MLRRTIWPSSRRLFHDTRIYSEDKRWPGWQVIIGIETHAQIKSRQKLFSDSSLTFKLDEPPNTHVSLFDAAFPGTLPKINPKCVDLALRTAIALNCEIKPRSSFDRKHYFYSDLPSGYQITQQYAPIALKGRLDIQMPNSSSIPVRIKQLQLEQDTAKSTFIPRKLKSHIDLNRAGTGLMEIVSEPDLRSPEEAGAYVRTLQSVLRAIGSSDGNMEEGSLRCDVNVSVNRVGNSPGTRCEIKNLNSVRFMMAATIYEIKRQCALIWSSPDPDTATVPQETRGFNENTFETYKLRSKEDAPDYRYMPDPNLGILTLSQERIQSIKSSLPELPWVTLNRLRNLYGLSHQDAEVLLKSDSTKEVPYDGEQTAEGAGTIAYFYRLCTSKSKRDPKVVMNWMMHASGMASQHQFIDVIPSMQLGEIIDLVQSGTITGTSGKYLLRHIFDNPSSAAPTEIARELQLIAFKNPPSLAFSSRESAPKFHAASELLSLCEAAIATLPAEVAAVRNGNMNVLNKIVGKVMKDSRGRADAKVARTLLEQLISEGHS